jgi:hypothetical protein
MGETNIIQIQIPTCSSNYQISKDIYSFLNKQGNHIPISLLQKNGGVNKQSGGFSIPFFGNIFAKPDTTNHTTSTTNTTTEEEKEEEEKEEKTKNNSKPDEIKQTTNNHHDESNNMYLQFQNKTHTLDNIKGTKLYYLYLRNGECARWV